MIPEPNITAPTNTVGGGRDLTAVVGHAPQSRDWKPGDPAFKPEIDPSARLEAFVSVDAGTVRATTVGARTWLMKNVHVGHDAIIGEDCELAPGAVVCGHVEIGDRVKMGVNSCVIPFVRIGAGARVGAGTTVIAYVPPGRTVVGNPGRILPFDPENNR